jgi:hypothetical protein
MAKYVPSGKAGGAGLALTVGLAAVAGLVLGVAVHFVGRAFYLLLLFPFLWGLGIGLAASAGVRLGKCRNVTFAAMSAILASIASYGAYQALENWHVRTQLKEAIRKAGGDPDADYDEYMKSEYGATGFEAELKFRSEAGMNIGRPGRGGEEKKPLISGTGMYVYWLLELGIIGVMGVLPAAAQAKSLFCEPCGAWYGSRPALGVALDRAPAAAAALEKKDWAAFAACVGTGGVLSLEKCPACEKSPIGVVLETVVAGQKGKEVRSRLHESLLSREDANALLAAVAPKQEEASG